MIEPIRNTQDGWPGETLTAKDYLDSIEPSAADARMAYGPEPSQWVDVYLPKRGAGPFPVVILVHGGAWSTVASADALGPNAAELAAAGVAVWNVPWRYERLPLPSMARTMMW